MLFLNYTKKTVQEFVYRQVELVREDGYAVAEFSIDGKGYDNHIESFDSGNACSITISIDEEYKNKGYEKMMFQTMIAHIREEYPIARAEQLLFVDADASVGFWDKVGMKVNRYAEGYHREVEGRGYEKVITFQDLEKYAVSQ
jgi:ribosomal protein S18 acetylase RimI-like enzyme